jgi:hypothetical protein
MILKWKQTDGSWWIREDVKNIIYTDKQYCDEKEYEKLYKEMISDTETYYELAKVTTQCTTVIKDYEGTEYKELVYVKCNDDEKNYAFITELEIYLLNDNGKTIERIN